MDETVLMDVFDGVEHLLEEQEVLLSVDHGVLFLEVSLQTLARTILHLDH